MNKRTFILCTLTIVTCLTLSAQDYHIQKIDLKSVHLTDSFWLPRIRQIQQITIPVAIERCEKEGRFENFLVAERVMNGGSGVVRGKMPFDDTDLYKIIEGA
ncbi:MAG: glycoside hydrolase family 127 protein, partial [Bacteroidales bacterium]|nr:glycoside hydrolase family 127 protein [Bacteroidales bacterium]